VCLRISAPSPKFSTIPPCANLLCCARPRIVVIVYCRVSFVRLVRSVEVVWSLSKSPRWMSLLHISAHSEPPFVSALLDFRTPPTPGSNPTHVSHSIGQSHTEFASCFSVTHVQKYLYPYHGTLISPVRSVAYDPQPAIPLSYNMPQCHNRRDHDPPPHTYAPEQLRCASQQAENPGDIGSQ